MLQGCQSLNIKSLLLYETKYTVDYMLISADFVNFDRKICVENCKFGSVGCSKNNCRSLFKAMQCQLGTFNETCVVVTMNRGHGQKLWEEPSPVWHVLASLRHSPPFVKFSGGIPLGAEIWVIFVFRLVRRVLLCVCWQMDVRNLAIIFGPTLLQLKDDSVVGMVKDMSSQCQIVEAVVLHVSYGY